MAPRRNRAAGLVALVVGLAMALRRLRRITVHGPSMLPALAPGDRVVALPAWRIRPGDIVVLPHPTERRLLVKRVTAVDRRDRSVCVEGDNRHASTDSRTFGPIARRSIMGRVVYRYAPGGRAGRISNRGGRSAERYHQRE